MGFFSGIGRGLRGVLNGAAGTQALIAGDYGTYAQLRDRQMRLRAAQDAAEAESMRRKGLFDQLVEQGLDPAQAELAVVNPEFARRFLPGFGSPRPAPIEPFGGPDSVAIEHEHERGHPFLPAEFGGDAFGPDGLPVDPHPGRSSVDAFDAVGSELVSGIDPRVQHLRGTAPPVSAVATWQGELGVNGAEFQLAGQDGYDRHYDIRMAQERARARGTNWLDELREMRGLPSPQELPAPVAAQQPQVRKPPAPPPRAVPSVRDYSNIASPRTGRTANSAAAWRPGGRWSRQVVEGRAANAMRMYKLHRLLGTPPELAAGWAANAEGESGSDYRARFGPGRGLFQWGSHNPALDRRRDFQRVFGYPIEQSSEKDQLAFRDWELAQPSFRRVARRINQATTAGDVADAVIITRGLKKEIETPPTVQTSPKPSCDWPGNDKPRRNCPVLCRDLQEDALAR